MNGSRIHVDYWYNVDSTWKLHGAKNISTWYSCSIPVNSFHHFAIYIYYIQYYLNKLLYILPKKGVQECRGLRKLTLLANIMGKCDRKEVWEALSVRAMIDRAVRRSLWTLPVASCVRVKVHPRPLETAARTRAGRRVFTLASAHVESAHSVARVTVAIHHSILVNVNREPLQVSIYIIIFDGFKNWFLLNEFSFFFFNVKMFTI